MGILTAIIVGGLLFLYFNIKCRIKVNISYAFLHIYGYIIIFRKRYEYKNTIDLETIKKMLIDYKDTKEKGKINRGMKYLKYYRRVKNIFIITNINLYPEYLHGKQCFSIEFVIVNRIFKKTILNG